MYTNRLSTVHKEKQALLIQGQPSTGEHTQRAFNLMLSALIGHEAKLRLCLYAAPLLSVMRSGFGVVATIGILSSIFKPRILQPAIYIIHSDFHSTRKLPILSGDIVL